MDNDDDVHAIVVTTNNGEPFIVYPHDVVWCNGERCVMSPLVTRLVHRLVDDIRNAHDDVDALRIDNDALHTEVTALRRILLDVSYGSLPREFWSDIHALIENE